MTDPVTPLRHHHAPGFDLQRRFDAAVVMPSILRPTIAQAVRSVFAQDLPGTIQMLVGIDDPAADLGPLDAALAERPDNCVVTVLDLGYSTAVPRGGLHAERSGGALRTILSYAANSRYLAYLDDDNWLAADHLSSLRSAIRGVDWAWSLRWFVDADSGAPACIDAWESVGPDAGVFRDRFRGWVDPNCLMIDKIACEAVLAAWTLPLAEEGDGANLPSDRRVYRALVNRWRGKGTGRATSYYRMRPEDANHAHRLAAIRAAAGRTG